MRDEITRRGFMAAGGALAVGAAGMLGSGAAHAASPKGRFKKAVNYGMIKEEISVEDKFKLLQDVGFDGVEVNFKDETPPETFLAARDKTGLPIHGVVLGSVDGIKAAVDRAALLGATGVLCVAGRVNESMPYARNYEETQAKLRQAIPYAAEKKMPLLVENVWNYFLLSPLEMARYIDELDSEWVAGYFDAGNVARFGWPEHWIPVLGKRIQKVHIKAYSRKKRDEEGPWKGFDLLLGEEGDLDWSAVRGALADIGYTGWVTAEVRGGDRAYLADLSGRMDRVLGME